MIDQSALKEAVERVTSRLRARDRDFGCRPGENPALNNPDGPEAADLIDRLSESLEAMASALEWYGEQARLARLIHSEGDPGRHALAADGGNRARQALNQEQPA